MSVPLGWYRGAADEVSLADRCDLGNTLDPLEKAQDAVEVRDRATALRFMLDTILGHVDQEDRAMQKNDIVPPARGDQTAEALALRRAGMTYRQMARALNCSTKKAWTLIQKAMCQVPLSETAREVRTMELERLDALQLPIWNRATSGDLPAVDRVLKIINRRVQLVWGQRYNQA